MSDTIRRADGTPVSVDDLPEGSGVLVTSAEKLIPDLWLGFSIRQYVREGKSVAHFVTEFIPVEENAKRIVKIVGARSVKVESVLSGPGLWEVQNNSIGEVAQEIAEASFTAGKQIVLEHEGSDGATT